jgi:V/A-type H+-transporting ATPase subunit C
MALYDYGNTRLRARLSELLPIEKLESFSGFTTIESLISSLTKTTYKETIEEALTYAHGYECVNQAMKIASAGIYKDLMRFYQDDEQEKVRIIFYRNDLQNLKAIFRGVLHQVPIEQIIDSFSHMGTLPEITLQQLVKSEDLNDLINRMAVFQLPVSQPLLVLRSSKTLLRSADIELAMEKWYFHEIQRLLNGNSEDAQLLRKFYNTEADIVNLNTALRFVGSEKGHEELGDRIGDYWIEGGDITIDRWNQLVHITPVQSMVQQLFNTRYKKFLAEAVNCYQSTGMLSEFENQMRMYLLAWSAGLPSQYPLGIGVVLGYVALKRSEIKNLRWIAKGIESGFEAAYIRENLEIIQ